MNLIERVKATQETIDTFVGLPFEWGVGDCGQLAGQHLEALGIETPLARVAGYTTEIGARRAIRKLDANSMEDVVDALGFERIAPAAALVGDLVGFPGGRDEDHAWTALGVHTGGDRIIGFADPDGSGGACHWGPVSICTVAWRVG